MNNANSDLSLWWDALGELPTHVPADLPNQTDVAIVGGGFTGLWTAYYLKQFAPQMDITLIEAETPGYGASGRNGGWCMGEAEGIHHYLENPATAAGGRALQQQMFETVDEIGRVCQAENIDCHFSKGGWLRVARYPFQVAQLKSWVQEQHQHGTTEADYRWLSPAEAGQRFSYAENLGAAYASNCAVIQPARLARGLAATIKRQGVQIIEQTRALEISPRLVKTDRGDISCERVLRATEGYTATLADHARTMLPLYSMIVATEPLPESVWQQIGLAEREVWNDPRRLTIYGQRTLDGRMVLGGRASYYFGSGIKRAIAPDNHHVQRVRDVLLDIFPQLKDFEITHGWGGLMGVPRHWRPCVSYDQASGMGWAGGYVGEGVGATNLAARTLADLVLGQATERTELPWVEDLPRRWEPEPLRWLGAKSLRWMSYQADAAEARTGAAAKPWHFFTG